MAKNILITGTNSGFGRLAALTLAQRGHTVFATMRDVQGRNRGPAEELQAAAPGSIHVVEMVLTSQTSVDAAVRQVLDKVGHLDVVLSNAGYAAFGLEETLTDEQVLRQLDVNVVGTHRLLRAVLPGMRERQAGYIIYVSSILARAVFPFMGAYCASKAALEALVDAYRYELKHLGVEHTLMQPGAFPTGAQSHLDAGQDTARAAGYGHLADGPQQLGEGLATMLSGPDAPDPMLVINAIVELVDSEPGARPDRVVVDIMDPKGIEAVNEAHRVLQKESLGALGLADLADR